MYAVALDETKSQSRRRLFQATLMAFVVFCVLWVAMGIWVHWSFQGHWWGPFLPGSHFGVPEMERELYGIFPTSRIGWDAQFYYYQSNDLLALGEASTHIDNPPYRYQRIGSPLLARLFATVTGQSVVSPILYHFVQIAVVSLGFGFLVWWLLRNGRSSLWTFAWLASEGVLNALAFGMPDPVGDAIFIIAMVGLLVGRPAIYVPAATFCALVREPYIAIFGLVFIFTVFGHLRWSGAGGKSSLAEMTLGWLSKGRFPAGFQGRVAFLKRLFGPYSAKLLTLALLTVPGVVFLSWHFYLTMRFGLSPSSAGGGTMLDLPFKGWWDGFEMAVDRSRMSEVLLHILGLAVALLAIKRMWQLRMDSVLPYLFFPYIGLVISMSWVAWEDYSGYMKALGTVIVMVILTGRISFGWRTGLCFLILMFQGPIATVYRKMPLMFLPHAEVSAESNTGAMQGRVAHVAAHLELIDGLGGLSRSEPSRIFAPFHRSIGVPLRVQVTNTSTETWLPRPMRGLHAVTLSYQWWDGERLVLDGEPKPIQEVVAPGESIEITLSLRLPEEPGQYLLRISMLQEGHVWYYHEVDQIAEPVDLP
jgi:hypothetical protein